MRIRHLIDHNNDRRLADSAETTLFRAFFRSLLLQNVRIHLGPASTSDDNPDSCCQIEFRSEWPL